MSETFEFTLNKLLVLHNQELLDFQREITQQKENEISSLTTEVTNLKDIIRRQKVCIQLLNEQLSGDNPVGGDKLDGAESNLSRLNSPVASTSAAAAGTKRPRGENENFKPASLAADGSQKAASVNEPASQPPIEISVPVHQVGTATSLREEDRNFVPRSEPSSAHGTSSDKQDCDTLKTLALVKWEAGYGALGVDAPPSGAEFTVLEVGDTILGRGKFGISDAKVSREQVQLNYLSGNTLNILVKGVNVTHILKGGSPNNELVRVSREDKSPFALNPGDAIVFTVEVGAAGKPTPKANIFLVWGVGQSGGLLQGR